CSDSDEDVVIQSLQKDDIFVSGEAFEYEDIPDSPPVCPPDSPTLFSTCPSQNKRKSKLEYQKINDLEHPTINDFELSRDPDHLTFSSPEYSSSISPDRDAPLNPGHLPVNSPCCSPDVSLYQDPLINPDHLRINFSYQSSNSSPYRGTSFNPEHLSINSPYHSPYQDTPINPNHLESDSQHDHYRGASFNPEHLSINSPYHSPYQDTPINPNHLESDSQHDHFGASPSRDDSLDEPLHISLMDSPPPNDQDNLLPNGCRSSFSVKSQNQLPPAQGAWYNGVNGLVEISEDHFTSADNDILVPFMMNITENYPELVSGVPPSHVSTNCSFIIDLSKLKHPEDLLCDELGAWHQTGTVTKTYKVHQSSTNECEYITRAEKGTMGSIEVTRRPYKNLSDDSLKKIVVSISSSNSQYKLVFVRYRFAGDPHTIKVKTHGNSKHQTNPYHKVFKSTKELLSNELFKENSIQRAVFNVRKTVGGENPDSIASLPTGKDQASYTKKKSKDANVHTDPLYQITQIMANYKKGDERFIRSYTNDDSVPKIIAFTDQQMKEIVNFCCNDQEGFKSLLFTDITFRLGPFFLLLTIYNNTTLFTKGTKTCPVMLGPLMLCMLKDQATYDTLFQKMSSTTPGLKHFLQAYASDCETALRNSMLEAFPGSLAFLCMIHGKKNITEHCKKKLGLSDSLTRVIKRDIFSSGGLIYTDNSATFESECDAMKKKWSELEAAEKINPGFTAYFEKNKESDIKDHMRLSLSKEAGFGNQIVTTNPIESANAIIKYWNNFQPKDCATFLGDVEACVREQQINVEDAYLNLPSKYVVRDEFRHKIIHNYATMDAAGKRKARESVRMIIVDPARYKEVMSFKPKCLASLETKEPLTITDTVDPDEDPFHILASKIPRPDIDLLKRKAKEIVDRNQIIVGFSDNHYIVKSESSKYRTVSVLQNGKMTCDQDCHAFQTRMLCAHTVSTAMLTGFPNCSRGLSNKQST
uniref:Uncharacterized protein n=2 Tax=Clytia hemisphaerica TaxID=252671 RepID=A0A7M5WL89_9CNID